MKTKPEFSELEILPIALQNHFKRMQKDALKAAGISMEGANLSGLPEEPSELVTLLSNMAREVFERQLLIREEKEAEREGGSYEYQDLIKWLASFL